MTDKGVIDDSLFDLSRASDFSDSQISDYWVDLAGSAGLVRILKPTAAKPMLLLGSKGSGKTHLMRICSSSVQKIRCGSLSGALQKEGYIGIYARADGLNSDRFSGKGVASEVWERLFAYYYELWLAAHYLSVMRGYFDEVGISAEELTGVTGEIGALFDVNNLPGFENLLDVENYLLRLIKEIDYSANNSAFTGRVEGVDVKVSLGRLVYGLPNLVSNKVKSLENKRILFLIDEIENFTDFQQKYLNSLIRYRSGVASLKVGTRLYGIKTFCTLGAGEPIKRESEYDQIELDYVLRQNEKAYAQFIKKLVAKRLSLAIQGKEDAISSDLDRLFETADGSEKYRNIVREMVGAVAPESRSHFKKLKSHIEEMYGGATPLTNRIFSSLVELLGDAENPIFDKVNLLLLYRDWGDGSQLELKARNIRDLFQKFVGGNKKEGKRYHDALDHHKGDLLAQLARESQAKPIYAGLDTLIRLSQGVPRNFLGILRCIYLRAQFADERPFAGGRISIESQSEGVRDAAAWFWEDAQPDSYGYAVREVTDRLAEFFRAIRYSDKPAECSLSTFSIDPSERLTPASRELLKHAVNWSFLIRLRDGRNNKNNESLNESYQIAPMLAPKWGISESRRGVIEVSSELFNAIFSVEGRDQFQRLLERRVSSMNAPFSMRRTQADDDQGSLF